MTILFRLIIIIIFIIKRLHFAEMNIQKVKNLTKKLTETTANL